MRSLLSGALISAIFAFGQPPAEEGGKPQFRVEPGTKIPLSLIKGISSKDALVGDTVYLETAFPVVAGGRIVIPPGSYVTGTVTSVKRAGRVRGRAELFIRFDTLMLENGVLRDFRSRMSGMDGQAGQTLDRREGKVVADGNKSGDARTVGETAVAGTWIGTVAGSAASRAGMGAGVGAAAGAAAGMVGVLLSRGPEAVLAKGTTVEMVLDRELIYEDAELEIPPTRRKSYAQPMSAAPADNKAPRRRIGQLP